MGLLTGISWCHHTANLWWGCVEISPECDNCYAREWAKRFDRAKWGAHEPRLEMPNVWKELAKMQRDAARAEAVHSVFVGSMMDIAEVDHPLVDSNGLPTGRTTAVLRDRLFSEIHGGHYPNLLFLLLSKRPQNYLKMVSDAWRFGPPSNVWFGATAGTQKSMNANATALLSIDGPAGIFLSCEPLLEQVIVPEEFLAPNFADDDPRRTKRWLIAGGESGQKARFTHPSWVSSLRDQCESFGCPFHFKQWGEFAYAETGDHRDGWFVIDATGRRCALFPGDGEVDPRVCAKRVGKKASGRLLDGRTHDDLATDGMKPFHSKKTET